MRVHEVPDLDVIRAAFADMRPRMRAVLGRHSSVERDANNLLARAAKARLAARRRLVARLVRLFLASAVADLFRTTLAQQKSAADRRLARLERERRKSYLRIRHELIKLSRHSRRLTMSRRAAGVIGGASLWKIVRLSKRDFVKKGRGRPVKKPLSPKALRRLSREVAKRRRRRGVSRSVPRAPRPRVVNLAFMNAQGRAVAANRPLIAKRTYQLRVNIGDLARDSVVQNAARSPVRSDLLPPSVDGHWLKVAAVSSRFKIAEAANWLFLPTTGPSWCCACPPGGTHRCEPSARKRHLWVPVEAPAAPGAADIRLTLYFRISVVQSLRVTATIVDRPREQGSNHAVVDYNLTNRLTDLETVQPRALSVMMNESGDGTHRLVFNGAPDSPVTLTLTDDQMTTALGTMRAVLRDIHIEKIHNFVSNRYDNKNAKSLKDFVADLREAAAQGWQLWSSIWGDRIDEWTTNEGKFVGESNVIQVARKQNSAAVFPWAMVYSIPIDTGSPAKNRLCKLVQDKAEWAKFQAESTVPVRCPFEASHDQDVICPYGFWGFRYDIEQPPSLPKGRGRNLDIRSQPQPLLLVAALSQQLDEPLLKAHLDKLTAQHKHFTIRDCRTRDTIRDALGGRELEVAYFYCHGVTDPLPGGIGSTPSLGVGNDEVIKPPDLIRWLLKSWPKDHWKTVAPLVFINGCHTADTTPQTLVNFVDTFSGSLRAAGVIGTEITLHQLVANEVGQTFLDAFQRGNSVGAALRTARAALLRKGNLLGLAYTAYCSADLKFAASVV